MQVRIRGDALADGEAARALRQTLALLARAGIECELVLAGARGCPPGPGTREIGLTDGSRTFSVHSSLPPSELAPVLRAAAAAVAATAPVLVFSEVPAADARRLAELEHPAACAVLCWSPATAPAALVDQALAVLREAGTEDPEPCLTMAELEPWLALPAATGSRLLVHPGAAGPGAGTDLVVAAHARSLQAEGWSLRVVLPPADLEARDLLRALAARAAAPGTEVDIEFAAGPLRPEHLADAAAVALPWREGREPAVLLQALASGRPVIASRFSATGRVLAAPGICRPVGGTAIGEAGFAPDPRAYVAAVRSRTDPSARARAHVLRHHVADRTAAAPPPAVPACGRPLVVLEAPWFETSSAAELSIETALALQRRQNVTLRLVPVLPCRGDLDALRRRAPGLLPLLSAPPAGADLWLASGWPPRHGRPPAARFGVRVDWEYGALPVELCPLVSQEADLVVVHSRHVEAAVLAAGADPARVLRIPHGVDGATLHEDAVPNAEVRAFAGGRPAVLFVGGLIWRKGIDLFVRSLLAARAAGVELCAVVKAIGGASHYHGYHLGDLLRKLQRTAGAPPVLLLEDDMSRAGLAGLYTACDLLLHPYRGEGFGMPVLEARACGLPVLVTAGGSTDDFCSGGGVRRLPAGRRAVRLPEVCVDTPWVLEPDPEATAGILRDALADLPALRAEARASAAAIRARFTWDAAAAALEAAAVPVRDRRDAPASVLATDR